jgi:hypothetical protein
MTASQVASVCNGKSSDKRGVSPKKSTIKYEFKPEQYLFHKNRHSLEEKMPSGRTADVKRSIS